MYSWKIFDETSLPDKEALYSELNVKDITDKVFNDIRLKNLGGYHDLHVQSDSLLLADVFEKFRNKCIDEIYYLDPPHFLSAAGLT